MLFAAKVLLVLLILFLLPKLVDGTSSHSVTVKSDANQYQTMSFKGLALKALPVYDRSRAFHDKACIVSETHW